MRFEQSDDLIVGEVSQTVFERDPLETILQRDPLETVFYGEILEHALDKSQPESLSLSAVHGLGRHFEHPVLQQVLITHCFKDHNSMWDASVAEEAFLSSFEQSGDLIIGEVSETFFERNSLETFFDR